MVVVEFLFIAFVVGVLTGTWLGFLGTFFGLYALYRFTPLSAVLSLVLSLYWGFLGYHAGAATGELGAGPVLAVLGFAVGAWVHRRGYLGGLASADPRKLGSREGASSVHPAAPAQSERLFPGVPDGEILDAQYRVVS